MKSSAQTLACSPVSSCCPAYWETDGIMLGVISVPGLGWAKATGREVDLLLGELIVDVGVGKAGSPHEEPPGDEEHDHDDHSPGAGQQIEDAATHRTAPFL